MTYIKREFIEKAREVHGDKYSYSDVNFINMTNKVKIICPEHGEFWQTPAHHVSGCGCKKCGYEAAASKNKLSIEDFIKKAREVHGDKYDYSKVAYINYNTKVCIICPEHGEFWQTPSEHLKGHGCAKCNGCIPKFTTKEFINELKKIYGKDFDYSKVEYVNSQTKVCVICHRHGELSILPSKLLNGDGCSSCIQEKKIIDKFNKKYGDKYDYSKVNYINYDTKVCIICPEHGEFWQTPYNHLKGTVPCPKCNDERIKKQIEDSYNNTLQIAKKYNSVLDFRKNDKNAYWRAKQKGWFKDYTWIEKEDDIKLSKEKCQTIYVYEFSDNYAYVGLTNNLHSRDLSHRKEHKRHGKSIYDGVYNHHKENGVDIPMVKILETGLTRHESQLSEQKWKDYYEEQGWHMLNRAKCGSLGGGIHHVYTNNELEEICKKYKNPEHLKKANRKIYNYITKNKLQYAFFKTKRQEHKEKRNYTEGYIQDLVKKYPTKNDIRKNDVSAYQYLYTHGLLYKYYHEGWINRKC